MNSASEIQVAERRRTPRTKLNQIIYISLRQGNGGIVLDVSEGGLGFHAVRPIEPGDPRAFRFSVEPLGKTEIVGKLAWKDASGKSGGVQFTNLPDALHDQISGWLDRPSYEASHSESIAGPGEVKKRFPSEETPALTEKPRLVQPRVVPAKRARGRRTRMFVCASIVAIAINCLMAVRVHRFAEKETNERLAAETSQSALASRTVFDQVDSGLAREADLLSTLAAMTPDDESAIQTSIENALINDGSDLIAWADGTNEISALYTSDRSMTAATAEQMLIGSLRAEKSADWWFADGRLYQVALESVHHEPLGHDRSGTIVVGRRIDQKQTQNLADILGSQAAFTYQGKLIESTLNLYDEGDLSQQLQRNALINEIQIGQKRFHVSSIGLTDDTRPEVKLLILKPEDEIAGERNRGNRLLGQLVEVQTAILLGLLAFGIAALWREN